MGRSTNVVYFIQGVDGGPIKIGRTRNLKERLRSIQMSSPVRLRVLAAYRNPDEDAETKLHQRFRVHRLHGEWFEDCPKIRKFIRRTGADTFLLDLVETYGEQAVFASIERGRARRNG